MNKRLDKADIFVQGQSLTFCVNNWFLNIKK